MRPPGRIRGPSVSKARSTIFSSCRIRSPRPSSARSRRSSSGPRLSRRGAESWEIKFDLGTDPTTGKRLTRYRSFKGTKREAQIECARLIAARDGRTDVEASKATLAAYLDRFERDWLPGHVSARTAQRYSELLKHVRAGIGSIAIQRLQPAHVKT